MLSKLSNKPINITSSENSVNLPEFSRQNLNRKKIYLIYGTEIKIKCKAKDN